MCVLLEIYRSFANPSKIDKVIAVWHLFDSGCILCNKSLARTAVDHRLLRAVHLASRIVKSVVVYIFFNINRQLVVDTRRLIATACCVRYLKRRSLKPCLLFW